MSADFDLLVRGGTLADGAGGDLYEADVAVKEGHIVAVGPNLAGRAAEELDARGLLVTPGFVDIHTHYDGQVTWESRMAPSSDHGVTTIVTGNCGVGFAPCRLGDHDGLVALMAGVEDIPEIVMTDGLRWDWESFPDYLDAVARRPRDVDVAAMLPHSALRVYVMGQRAVDREPATADDIALMASLAREAMAAGAVGFGTSRAIQQKSIRGEPIPTVGAAEDELRGILHAVGEGGGVFQALSDFAQFTNVEGEFAMFRRLVGEAGVPMSYTLHQKHGDPEGWRRLLKLTEDANRDGLPIRAQVLPRPTGLLLGFELSMSPFSRCPTYAKLSSLPLATKLVELRKPEVRAAILEEVKADRRAWWGQRFELTNPPEYEPDPSQSLASRAEREGTTPAALAYDILLQDGGKRLIFEPIQDYAHGSLEPTYEMMRHPDTILGLGDGGAHLGLVCDASYPTTLLAYWTRDRVRGPRMPLAEAVKKLSADTARAIGLNDRGRIAPGLKADLNLIDYDRLQMGAPTAVYDLPAGGRRLVQKASGYVATVVSGEVTYRAGEATGALPGKLVRKR